MQTARQYLMEKGLAGKRGRLSAEAKQALQDALAEGIEFSDWNADGKIEQQKESQPATKPVRQIKSAKDIVKLIPIRSENAIKWTDASGMTGVMSTCSENHNISVCRCKPPKPKAYLNAVEHELIYSEYA